MPDRIKTELALWKPLRLRIGLFLLPIGAGLLLIISNAVVVPRAHVLDYMPVALRWSHAWAGFDLGVFEPMRWRIADWLKIETVAPRPAVLVALYHLAIADGVTLVLAGCVIGQCLVWSQEMLKRDVARASRRRSRAAVAVVVLALLAVILAEPGMVDDEAARTLFRATALTTVAAVLPFGSDARVVAGCVFLAYVIAAATTAIAATTDERVDGPRNMAVVRSTLLLTCVVMLASVVTAKFRWDAAVQMLPQTPGAVATPAVIAVRAVSDAIMNYWAAVLSVGLALIYGLPATLLYRRAALNGNAEKSGGADAVAPNAAPHALGLAAWLNAEMFGRVLRAIAILSPPLVNVLMSLLDTTSKG